MTDVQTDTAPNARQSCIVTCAYTGRRHFLLDPTGEPDEAKADRLFALLVREAMREGSTRGLVIAADERHSLPKGLDDALDHLLSDCKVWTYLDSDDNLVIHVAARLVGDGVAVPHVEGDPIPSPVTSLAEARAEREAKANGPDPEHVLVVAEDGQPVRYYRWGWEWDFEGGSWAGYFWARDHADAEARLAALKGSARLVGQVMAEVPA